MTNETESTTSKIEAMPVLTGMPLEGIPGVQLFLRGKVRDVFTLSDNELAFVTTDRVSAFDSVLGNIPGKGQVNTLLSSWWFQQMEDIIPNHMIAVPDPNVMIGKELKRIPIEVVVRGYITGVTDTSIWHSYEKGEREIYGIHFREGYKKNDQLDDPIITPTTKADKGHDERLTVEEIMNGKISGVTPIQWETVQKAALAMFTRAQEIARNHGYILVDTKMEFGMNEKGDIYVMDELFTPDSSRFWKADTYAQCIANGQEPENFDKEYLRIALKHLQNKDEWKPGKPIPHDLVIETARRYITLYEELTTNAFPYPDQSLVWRILHTMHQWTETRAREKLENMPWGVIIVAGSQSDAEHVEKIAGLLRQLNIPYVQRVGSVHKTLDHLMKILGEYKLSQRQLVFITVAGGTDALSGTVDGYLPFPVIAAPPERQLETIYVANLQTPKGIAPLYVIRPEAAALAAAKIFALGRPKVLGAVLEYQRKSKQVVIQAD